jgi:hypothetical protein
MARGWEWGWGWRGAADDDVADAPDVFRRGQGAAYDLALVAMVMGLAEMADVQPALVVTVAAPHRTLARVLNRRRQHICNSPLCSPHPPFATASAARALRLML